MIEQVLQAVEKLVPITTDKSRLYLNTRQYECPTFRKIVQARYPGVEVVKC